MVAGDYFEFVWECDGVIFKVIFTKKKNIKIIFFYFLKIIFNINVLK
jgi:hypothetical protein